MNSTAMPADITFHPHQNVVAAKLFPSIWQHGKHATTIRTAGQNSNTRMFYDCFHVSTFLFNSASLKCSRQLSAIGMSFPSHGSLSDIQKFLAGHSNLTPGHILYGTVYGKFELIHFVFDLLAHDIIGFNPICRNASNQCFCLL